MSIEAVPRRPPALHHEPVTAHCGEKKDVDVSRKVIYFREALTLAFVPHSRRIYIDHSIPSPLPCELSFVILQFSRPKAALQLSP